MDTPGAQPIPGTEPSNATDPTPGMGDGPPLSGEPRHPNGTIYTYEMLYAGLTRRVYADTHEALIDALIPGYATGTETQRWEARLYYMARAQVLAQAELNASDAFHSLDRAQQVVLQGPRHDPPVVPTWSCPVPLVLISSFYKPAGTQLRPVREMGMEPNVIWLDPSDDIAFLNSLHDIAVISLHHSTTPTLTPPA
jgi:hypothetical protein